MNSRRRVTSNVMPYFPTFVLLRICAVIVCIYGFSIPAFPQASINKLCGPLVEPNSPKPTAYFPQNAFNDSDNFTIDWYSKHLLAMTEPSMLTRTDCAVESYRFVWLRTFHQPIAVRVWRANGRHYLVVKELSGQGGYEPGRIVVTRLRSLAEAEWINLKRQLSQISFWNLPTEQSTVKNPDGSLTVGVDGAEWIIEGLQNGKYHVTSRWSAKGKYRKVCLYLLRLSNLRVKRTEIY